MWRLVVGYAERQQWPPRVRHAGCNERHGVHCGLIPYGGGSWCFSDTSSAPVDTIETLECWDIALRDQKTPSLLALSRQNVPQPRTDSGNENLCAKGAYVLKEASGKRAATLIATGTDVSLAARPRTNWKRLATYPDGCCLDAELGSVRRPVERVPGAGSGPCRKDQG
ncbi:MULTISPECIES: hypothetical protein [unclassified Rhizobium]|uniref:hypothetical protein n=1 Tax=unclassified Rhizobium TaxID=2613769 RepID=UPI00216958AC|nr:MULTISPECIES: hypothetical protein [unclassified Rhizobium]MCS3743378.1 hypothetical protein [Rhizobium sp. BK661]MCS4095903.1 hypothetical protein [Rhizobium sp. BK176]